MATLTESISQLRSLSFRGFDFRLFVQDQITRTWYLTAWLVFLTVITAVYVAGQLDAAPVTTIPVLVLWLVGLFLVIVGELTHNHTALSRWLKNRFYTSPTNTLLTLLLVLAIIAAVQAIWGWAVVRATFDPAVTAPGESSREGATWGVVWGARKLLATGTLEREHGWRVWLSLGFIVVMGLVSFFAFRPPLRDRVKPLRRFLTIGWLLSPLILFVFLAGVNAEGSLINVGTLITGELLVLAAYAILYIARVVKFGWGSFAVWALIWPGLYVAFRAVGSSGVFPPINVNTWGGFLFTMIVSVFAIVASFPLGLFLALGRRSQIPGIPGWLYWPIGLGVTIWGFASSTPGLLETARGFIQTLIAFWPVVPFLATLYLHFFRGNVVAAASTFYIEVVRGVPLITVLFMAIVMAPLFFPQGIEVKNAWAVMVAFALFTAAYLAENVRGGLQSIPKGQFEAADAIGLNTLQKMRFIILPQALRAVIPAIVGLFIGVFKDSSLVAVVGLFDLLGITNSIISNPQWLGLRRELYVFVAIIYFIGSFAMSSYSRRLEVRLGVGER